MLPTTPSSTIARPTPRDGVTACSEKWSAAPTSWTLLPGCRPAAAAGTRTCRATLLPDTAVHDVQGTPTLLMHGDLLCTDDVEYQRFRAYWKDPTRRHRLLARPYFVRRVIATVMRFGSRHATAAKSEIIMDV